MVDDIESNVTAAATLGMRGIHHLDATSTLARLRELLQGRSGATP